MTKQEMKVLLKKLKWSQAELARRLGLTPVSVNRWKTVPKYAEAYLRLREVIFDALGMY